MEYRITTEEYLRTEETNRPQELAFGVLREPPAPAYHHQMIVGTVYDALRHHVADERAGVVVLSPIDVILDAERHLVVQPDILFVAAARMGICREQIWGAPDLVIEVLSTSNRRHDREDKVGWYQHYGVRECWLIDPIARTVEVVDVSTMVRAFQLFDGERAIASAVLPRLRLTADVIFGG
jgi:Uma2 family endonuclease